MRFFLFFVDKIDKNKTQYICNVKQRKVVATSPGQTNAKLDNMFNTLLRNENSLYVVTGAMLEAFGKQLISETRKELQAELQAKQEDKLITRKDAREQLDVNYSTLWHWERLKYLTPVKIGGRVFYHNSDLNKLKGGAK